MKKPSKVQKHCIPQILSGKDVMGTAETGSGKTAAFALPILQALADDPYATLQLNEGTPMCKHRLPGTDGVRAFVSSRDLCARADSDK
eukprot:2161751-Pyramimonas_sp.AAC.1